MQTSTVQRAERDLSSSAPGIPRRCLACDYDLRGLGDEPQCPECGLKNIPDDFRRQVWELIDSDKILFSGPFQFFRKRPPGWWWALDRDGDLARTFWFAFMCIFTAGVIVIGGSTGLSCFALQVCCEWVAPDPSDPSVTVPVGIEFTYHSLVGTRSDEEFTRAGQWGGIAWMGTWNPKCLRGNMKVSREYHTMILQPDWTMVPGFCISLAALVLTWAVPALVGIWTQIRKQMPGFSKPHRTIMAAANLEAHRLIYGAVFMLAAHAMHGVGEYLSNFDTADDFWWRVFATAPLLAFFSCSLGWIGPLRSDQTRQLIRSRFHAGRIFVMYSLLFPAIITVAIAFLVYSVGQW